MFHNQTGSDTLKSDLASLLKEEGDFVQELSDVATKAAGFHARLESIEKALESDASIYSSKESNQLAKKAEKKYTSELEASMKAVGKSQING